MGGSAAGHCNCGYSTKRLLLGGGKANYQTTCLFPCYCADCKTLYVDNLYAEQLRCKECDSTNAIPYDDPQLQRDPQPQTQPQHEPPPKKRFFFFRKKQEQDLRQKQEEDLRFSWNTQAKLGRNIKITEGKYFCPACEEFNLQFSDRVFKDGKVTSDVHIFWD